jgi:4'-phosphopantetheinyl transferase EntD
MSAVQQPVPDPRPRQARPALITRLLPHIVAAAEAFTDPPDPALFPEEWAFMTQATDKRRREFATVRTCARSAMASMGVPPVPLLPGKHREPQWPAGVVGSMTHCDGYRAAAVARTSDLLSIGIDAEPHDPLPDDVLNTVTLTEERHQLRALGDDLYWDRILFCAKESVYKAWFPLARRWLGFTDARITLDFNGTFAAELLVPGPILATGQLTRFTGRWAVSHGFVLTAVALPP